jgi:OOP family OmpA-OmpF porin
VKWAKENPQATIMLTGYADKQTGTPQVNKRVSQRRVQSVKKALISRGIASSRIVTEAKGDTVQPFSENDQNRAVIIISENK